MTKKERYQELKNTESQIRTLVSRYKELNHDGMCKKIELKPF